jgi:hypothetical protein
VESHQQKQNGLPGLFWHTQIEPSGLSVDAICMFINIKTQKARRILVKTQSKHYYLVNPFSRMKFLLALKAAAANVSVATRG